MIQLTLFGTAGCHLCEEAEALLDEVLHQQGKSIDLVSVDIADHDEWMARYGIRIPFLLHANSGRELDWPFGVAELNSFIATAAL
jgi:thioredoxin-like negative regulator of GroEL